jgi:Asp-tRNA(Asn)/Glu-tRNA(Gln) amidotransferase A subunit family amidase
MLKCYSNFIYILALTLFISACQNKTEVKNIVLDELSTEKIHKAYISGEFNSEQLVAAYLDRILAQDSTINSITFINPNAKEVARELDEEYQRTGTLRPLHGIPLLVKDNINVKGIPTTAGSRALANYIPTENAFIIQKLVDAGAIILAKTNMAEWAFSAKHTESTTAGTTRNPYNLEYVPAGSSGGTGAAIASNFATIGLGTDTGNSIRGPSSHNALVGFRTTLGLVSRNAIVPLFLRNDVVGPMCRTVEDAARVLDVIRGYDPLDPITENSNGKIPENYLSNLDKNGLKGARIGVLSVLSEDIDPEINNLYLRGLKQLDSLGAIIINPVVVPNFENLRQNQWCATFRQDVEDFLADYVKKDSLNTLDQIIKIGTTSEFAKSRLENYSSFQLRWGAEDIPCGDAYSDPLRVAFRSSIEKTMDSLNLDALVYPTWSYPPATIDRFEEDYKGDNNQVIAPHTGQPAITVPMGYTSKNLPAGIQFLGRMYDESVLFKLAYSFERGTLYRKPPNLKIK